MGAVHVLLVDDDHRDLVDLTGLLEEAGFEVSTATNASQALEILATHATPIQIVITDVSMPGMSGFELLHALHTTHPHLPTIVTTRHPSTAGETLAHDFGAVAYVRKPVSVLLFLDAITRAATRRPPER